MTPTRDTAIAAARAVLDSGQFAADLARRVAIPSVSQDAAHRGDMDAYLDGEMVPVFQRLGFAIQRFAPQGAPGDILLASRIEDPDRPTVLIYGHGDVVPGVAERWSPGLSPFAMTERDGRWYGRGTADNKGQHSINLAALEAVLAVRGHLGFNVKFLVEMGEECGSPALADLVAAEAGAFAADMLIASDGPRIGLTQPTIFLGARGILNFRLEVQARAAFCHSGNWGGLLANPAVELAHAIAELIGPTGECRVPELTPGTIPDDVRAALARCTIQPAPGDPELDPWWGAPGLTQAERVYGWSTLEVLEMEAGSLAQPLNAIPPRARARLQLRHPVGVDTDAALPAVRRRLDAAGLQRVSVTLDSASASRATRSDLDNPWVRRVAESLRQTLGAAPVMLPNLGGSLPNSIFADTLGLPTIWVPHSYPGCGQHGADEHLPIAIAREGLAIMAGVFWDLGARD